MTKKLTPEEKRANLEARRSARGDSKVAEVVGKSRKVKPAKAAKAAKPAKAEKKAGRKAKAHYVKPYAKDPVEALPPRGHNSGEIDAPLQAIFDEYKRLEADKKVIAKAQAELKARAKEMHNVPKENFAHEIKMQKLELARRVNFESCATDLKSRLGIQLTLDLHGGDLDGDEEGDENLEDGGDDALTAAQAAAGVH